MDPFQARPASGSPPYLIAHRGISAKAPENTLAAFSLAAVTSGIDMIELDVRLTQDGNVIVLHDRTLQRTTTGNGAARMYTLSEVERFDAGSWFDPSFTAERIPTLRSILEFVRNRLRVNIEIKSDYFHKEPRGLLEEKVLGTVRGCGMEQHVMYSSFDHGLIASVKRIDPSAVTGVLYNLYRDFGKYPSKLARQANASIFVCAKHEIHRGMVKDAHDNGVAVYVYTLNSVGDTKRILDLGVDGIISDNADDIVGLVKSYRLA